MPKVLDTKISEVPLVEHSPKTSERRKAVVVIFTAVLVLLFLVIALLIVLAIVLNPSSRIQETDEPKSMLHLGSFEIDPCEDFYEYSCGNYFSFYKSPKPGENWNAYKEAQNRISKDLNEVLRSKSEDKSKAVINTKKYYAFCLNATLEDIKPVINIIKEFGNSSLFGSFEDATYNNNEDRKLENNIRIAMKYHSYPIFSVRVSMENPPLINIRKPTVSKINYSDFRKAVIATLEIIGNFNKKEKAWKITEKKEALIEEMWKLEKNLTELGSKTHHESMQPIEFEKLFPIFKKMNIDIEKLMQIHFKDAIKPNTVLVFNYEYFSQLPSVIDFYSKNSDVLTNYIIWTLLKDLSSITVINPFKSAEQMKSQKKESERIRDCVKETIEKFEFSTARIYVDAYINSSEKAAIKKIAANLKKEVLKNKYNFFDNETFGKAKLKANKTAFSILYPDFILDDSALDDYYNRFEDYESTEDYWKMNVGYLLWKSTLQSKVIGPSRNPEYWLTSPIDAMAFAHHTLNRVYVLAGLAVEPLYFSMAPPEVQYGSLGMTMAHELSHLFLPHGTNFDGDGRTNDWLSNTSKKSFVETTRCFIDFYSKMSMFGRKIEGSRVLREATADSGGLFLAYKALESILGKKELEKNTNYGGLNLSKSQTFFLSYAQKMCSVYNETDSERFYHLQHTFNNIRLKGTLQNSKEFAKAFNCKVGSTYNPEHKCLLYND